MSMLGRRADGAERKLGNLPQGWTVGLDPADCGKSVALFPAPSATTVKFTVQVGQNITTTGQLVQLDPNTSGMQLVTAETYSPASCHAVPAA